MLRVTIRTNSPSCPLRHSCSGPGDMISSTPWSKANRALATLPLAAGTFPSSTPVNRIPLIDRVRVCDCASAPAILTLFPGNGRGSRHLGARSGLARQSRHRKIPLSYDGPRNGASRGRVRDEERRWLSQFGLGKYTFHSVGGQRFLPVSSRIPTGLTRFTERRHQPVIPRVKSSGYHGSSGDRRLTLR